MSKLIVVLSLLIGASFCSAADEREEVEEYEFENENENGNGSVAGKYSYLALGDSYTIGQGVLQDARWPVILADSLRKAGLSFNDPQIIARTGWTTGELKAAIADAKPVGPFDIVSLLIGVNNQYRGVQRGYTLEGYSQEFTELLNTAIEFAGGSAERVFVVSIPDYSVTPFVESDDKSRVSAEIDQYNAVNLQDAHNLKVKYFDITPVSRLAEGDPLLLAPDNLHPSGRMYKMWVDIIAGDIIKLLKAD